MESEKELLEVLSEIRDTLHVIAGNTERLLDSNLKINGVNVNKASGKEKITFPTD